MHKYMIQAATAEELRDKLLDMARLLGGVPTEKPEVKQDTRTELPELKFKPATPENVLAAMSNSIMDDIPMKPVEPSRAEQAQARIDAAFSPKVEVSTDVSIMNQGLLDNRGVPWNADVHSAAKSTNKDGSWRGQRGVSKETIAAYESQFLGQNSGGKSAPQGNIVTHELPSVPAPAPVPQDHNPMWTPPSPVPSPTLTVVPPPVASAPTAPPIPAEWNQPPPQMWTPPAALAPAEPQYDRPAHTLETFKSNIPLCVAELIRLKKIDQPWIQGVFGYYKITGFEQIMRNEAMANDFFQKLVDQGLIIKVG